MSQLHFTVFAPGYLSTQQMFDIARYARSLAEALGFEQVQPVVAMEYDVIEQMLHRLENYDLWEPFFCRSLGMDEPVDYELWMLHLRRVSIRRNVDPDDEDLYDLILVPPQRLVGFHATAGKGCTEFRLTFAQYPVEVFEADSRLVFGWWAEDAVYEQRAYEYGEAHFIQCHLRHILLLKSLKRRFPLLKMKIDDPTGYWKTGSVDTLLRRMRQGSASGLAFRKQWLLPISQEPPETEEKILKVAISREELQHNAFRN